MSDEMMQVVRSAVAEVFDAPLSEIDAHSSCHEVEGWDSLGHTILIMRLEKRCGLVIPERIACEAHSIGALAAALADLNDQRRLVQ